MDPSHEPMQEAMLILAAAALVIPLFHRLKLSPVLGFILVGLVVGPSGLGAFQPAHPWLGWIGIGDRGRIDGVAELGVVLLLFMIGLEMSFQRLRTMRRLVLGLGTGQVLLSALAIWAVAVGAGLPHAPAVVLGLALAMSSTAIVVQVLAEEKRVGGAVGRATLAVLLFQDVSVVPVMFAMDLLGDSAGPAALLAAVAKAVGAMALLTGLGRLLLRPLFRWVARTGSPDLFMAACLLVVLATGLGARAAGLSMSMGALVSGLLLADTEYRRQIEVTVEPFKGLLLGVFLIAVGLKLDLSVVLAHPAAVAIAATGLVAAKAGIVVLLGRAMRLPVPIAAGAGLLLGPGGEFSYVILGVGTADGLLPPDVAGFAYVIAALTMATIPLQSWLGRRLFPLPATPIDPAFLPPEPADAAPPVILAGFGRVGQTVASLLEAHKLPYLALDANVRAVGRARDAGRPVYYGDATHPDLLQRVGLGSARAMVVTVDDGELADRIVQAARIANPHVLLVVRARDARHAARLYALGASDAVPETIEASLQLAEAVLVDLGVAMGPVLVSIHERRAAFQAEIKARAPHAQVRLRGRSRLRNR